MRPISVGNVEIGALKLSMFVCREGKEIQPQVRRLLEKILMFQGLQKPGNVFVAIAILFAFANGVRATFAYHKLATAKPTASDPRPLVPR